MSQRTVKTFWLQCIHQWYPHLHTKTYFLPPLHFNRVPYSVANVANESILVKKDTQSKNTSVKSAHSGEVSGSGHRPAEKEYFLIEPTIVNESDVRDDRAQERVLHCLYALSERYEPKQVMMVVSHLQFIKYLSKPCYTAANASFPRPLDLPHHYRRGDCDVLIIHSQLGLIICEVKSVGANFDDQAIFGEEHVQDACIRKRIKEAIKQLVRAQYVLQHLMSDLHGVNLRKTIIMPNVDSSQLQRAISKDNLCAQELCNCLGVRDLAAAVQMCLCADHLPPINNPSVIQNDVEIKLCDWWTAVTSSSTSEGTLSSSTSEGTLSLSTYEELIARAWVSAISVISLSPPSRGCSTCALPVHPWFWFCGPSTTVDIYCISKPRIEIRTEGEAISEVGERMARLVLVPEQVNLVNSPHSTVFLVGPPGTGKTVTLILKGLCWMQKGHDVHVVSTWDASRATSTAIKHQLEQTFARWPSDKHLLPRSQIHRHQHNVKNKDDLEKAVKFFSEIAKEKNELFMLADEAGPENVSPNPFGQFCNKLMSAFPKINLWAAAVHLRVRPRCMQEFIVTAPLRSPPNVTTEIEQAREMTITRVVYSYTNVYITETEGPKVRVITHSKGQSGHNTSEDPDDCELCGRNMAFILKELHVGLSSTWSGDGPTIRPPDLQYSDVFVLCDKPRDFRCNIYGQVTSTTMGLVVGLRSCGIPVQVVDSDDEYRIRDTALGLIKDVIVTSRDTVRGLERKVVFVTVKTNETEEKVSKSKSGHVSNRLQGASRCTSQLVLITWRPSDEAVLD